MRRTVAIVIVFALGLTACTDTDPASVTTTTSTSTSTSTTTTPSSTTTTRAPVLAIGDLEGSWTATSHVFTDASDPSTRFDLVANGGETRITVLEDGRTRVWVEIGPTSDEWDSLVTLSSGTLTLTPAEESRPVREFRVTLVDGTLTLSTDDASFDFTLADGERTAANETIVLERS